MGSFNAHTTYLFVMSISQIFPDELICTISLNTGICGRVTRADVMVSGTWFGET